MSLKTFHIIFIAFSTLFAFGFGVWFMNAYSGTNNSLQLLAGFASFLSGVGLIVYGIRFLKKLRHIKFL